MGVQGLWELLAPVGRRVSVETLAGKRLAIDASIWMIQFLKAMRDEKGEMVRNAHVLGFFRRICKLLFLRTKPVFVFDGGTPALKRRTVTARRRHRENAQAKIRKTAEKLLLNHLKTKRLEELAQEIKKSASNGIKENVNADKGKQVVSDENWCGGEQSGKKTDEALSQETLDEMLAASLAAEEEEEFNGDKMTSTGDVQHGMEQDDEDEDEEMILPTTSSIIDPSVLASLPPSMQLDLLVQMRERQIAENRQKYQKIKKTPTKFSELQIQTYLKTVAFRREINEVQKCAAGRGLEGVQSSRIASEANREFIFSSSFTGDKQTLSARAVEKNGPAVNQSMKKTVNLDSVKHSLFTCQTQSPAGFSVDKVTNDFGNDVETYHDENGRVRVSRVRGLGIRMTRDLQRNLDFMKEHEDYDSGDIRTDLQSKCSKEVSSATCIPRSSSLDNVSISNEGNSSNTGIKMGTLTQDGNQCSDDLSVHDSKATIEISFLEDDSGIKDTDDNLFVHLVSGTSTSALFPASSHSDRSVNESESECDWEEGMVGENNESQQISQKREGKLSLAEDNSCEDFEVEWEQGDCDVPNPVSTCEAEQGRTVSRGLVEEEAGIEEAIRRSLQDIEIQEASTESAANENLGVTTDDQNPVASTQDLTFEDQLPPSRDPDRSPFPCPTVDVQPTVKIKFDEKTIAAEGTIEKPMVSSELDVNRVKTPHFDEDGLEHHVNHDEQCIYTSEEAGVVPPCSRISKVDFVDDSPHFDFNTVGNPHEAIPANAYAEHNQNFEISYSVERKEETVHAKQCSLTNEKIINNDTVQEEVMENHSNTIPTVEASHFKAGRTTHGELGNNNAVLSEANLDEETIPRQEHLILGDEQIPTVEASHFKAGRTTYGELDNNNAVSSEANLNEEISILRQERLILGDEQRKLERNAESVSSEMFAECQELLQMFGLPYIIAPMEAEAQCAYMEMSSLVDGVVTDDSDVFLFGARNVYKNIFDDRKYVETYFMKDIESELGLNRETLIRMALLLGSDYTEGVSGIGIVNAIEVVRAFPEEDGLQKFREWIESPDPSILGKLDSHSNSNSKKRSVKSSNKDGDGMRDNAKYTPSEEGVSRGEEDQSYLDDIDHIKEIFMTKHRNVSKNWHLPSSFPSETVITAYISPQIDDSTEPFTWGKPDLLLLRKLCWERFGWGNKKADELLVPVLKEYDKHQTQLRMEAFYTFNERFAKIRSQRIKKAVKGITGKCSTELINDPGEASRSRKKRGCDPSAEELHKSANSSKPKDNGTMKASKKPRRRNTENQNMESENRGGDPSRGGGRGRGRGRGRKEEELSDYSAESNSSDDYGEDGGMEKNIQIPEVLSELRRSKRRRKQVKYAEEEGNVEVDIRDADDAAKGQESVEQGNSIRAERSPNACSLDDDSHSKDYIQSGGGFCMDESEMQVDTNDLDGGSVKKDLPPNGQSMEEPTGGSSQVIEQVESLEPEEVEAVNPGLKAMPYLRKKRKI